MTDHHEHREETGGDGESETVAMTPGDGRQEKDEASSAVGAGGPGGVDEERDLTDERARYDWTPRYSCKPAKRRIRLEALYVALLLLACPVALIAIWDGALKALLDLAESQNRQLSPYAYAWVSGTLGGTAFVTKWLYHSVARGWWHMDRTLWRLYTPHLSGAFALALVALANSGIIQLIDEQALQEPAAAVGVGFILGYFSDYTAAALADVARHLLGDPEARRQRAAVERREK
jgi:uncharacterized membrane protein (Fun14 family)